MYLTVIITIAAMRTDHNNSCFVVAISGFTVWSNTVEQIEL